MANQKINKPQERVVVGICPLCGQEVVEKAKSYQCSSNKFHKNDDGEWEMTEGCGLKIWKTIAHKKITPKIAKVLLSEGKTDMLSGFKSKAGKEFQAALKLEEDGSVTFVFDDQDDDSEDEEEE